MRISTIAWVIIILAALGGGWYYYSTQVSVPVMSGSGEPSPSGAAGTNGSPNQGNLGQQNNGAPQQPMADGAEGIVIGANLALGTDVNTKLGTYLTGYNGAALYTKDGDTANASSCYGQCAQNWPPYVVGAEDNVHQVKAGVAGSVDTFTRSDGTIQVTYKGKPLYFYASDSAAAGAKGDGVGGVWHIAKP